MYVVSGSIHFVVHKFTPIRGGVVGLGEIINSMCFYLKKKYIYKDMPSVDLHQDWARHDRCYASHASIQYMISPGPFIRPIVAMVSIPVGSCVASLLRVYV